VQAVVQPPPRTPLLSVVQQHAEEVAALRRLRTIQTRASYAGLRELRRLDDRIAAHIDGLNLAGSFGSAFCLRALAHPESGSVFAAAVNAVGSHDDQTLSKLIAIAGPLPTVTRDLISAFGWVSAHQLRGLVHPLLQAEDPLWRALGVAACRVHHVDPGIALADSLQHDHAEVRIQALRAAGALGRIDLLQLVVASSREPAFSWEAARSACLLGDRKSALALLEEHALSGTEPVRSVALTLLLQALDHKPARQWLGTMGRTQRGEPARERLLLRASGVVGDTLLVPWIISKMSDDRYARLAGEAFSTITGADLTALNLERPVAPSFTGPPGSEPEDDVTVLDESEGLPWPDADAVQGWWASQAARWHAGTRFFMGAPTSVAHCESILGSGTQRQRNMAAHYLCLLQPGRKLFNCAAPAWRQQRLLGLRP
jgi:uncharacterized protein (TIGR02270 family)